MYGACWNVVGSYINFMNDQQLNSMLFLTPFVLNNPKLLDQKQTLI